MTFDRLSLISLCIVVILIIASLMVWILKRQRRKQNAFTSSAKAFSRKQRRTESSKQSSTGQFQSCSYCKRKVNPKELSFYSGPEKVVGVCKTCKPLAERQALLRL